MSDEYPDPEQLMELNADCKLEEEELRRPEYLSVMVHFYRAEVARSTQWRQRLDATTNWAVLISAGMLSFVFSSPDKPHILVLLSSLFILAFLTIEARRFRYFEVYRARVRMLEENFILPIITRHLTSPMSRWREEIAQDLDSPRFKCTFLQAAGFRLRQNYLLIFSVLLGGWCVKLFIHPTVATSLAEAIGRAAVGKIPALWVIASGVLFYSMLLAMLVFGWKIHGDAPSDEIEGLAHSLDDWKM